ncbi:MAG TPA: ECF transporter S component [bacterium]|nr:ECF transporter S component [bacterium]
MQGQGGLSTRGIVISAVLAAIAIFLGATRLGFIPMPTGIAATIMHVPAIVGAILEGPVVGGIIGTIFGLYSFFYATTPMFKDPIVAIVPRIFIGIFAAWAYMGFRRSGEVTAITIAAIVGTATNTILVLGFGVARHYLPAKVAWTVAFTHGIPEIIVAVIISLAVLLGWKRVQRPEARARV